MGGCFGTKAGMTTWFTASGEVYPCTIIAIENSNIITQIKSSENDGYDAVQIGYKHVSSRKLFKPEIGHLKKAPAPPLRHLTEFKTKSHLGLQTGKSILLSELFCDDAYVNVSGTSIGKGFQGGIKRWKMRRGLMTHGSKSKRAPGTIGMRYSGGGGRVMPGIKMPGRLGNKRVSIRNLLVLKIDEKLDAIIVRGSVPGKTGSILKICQSSISTHI